MCGATVTPRGELRWISETLRCSAVERPTSENIEAELEVGQKRVRLVSWCRAVNVRQVGDRERPR